MCWIHSRNGKYYRPRAKNWLEMKTSVKFQVQINHAKYSQVADDEFDWSASEFLKVSAPLTSTLILLGHHTVSYLCFMHNR